MEENLVFYLAKLIKGKLREDRLTLRQAAEISKISASTLSRLIRCETIPDRETLFNLSNWLKVSIDYLLQIPHQLTFYHDAIELQIGIHFRGKRKKMEAYSEEVNELLLKIIRLAYKQFQSIGP